MEVKIQKIKIEGEIMVATNETYEEKRGVRERTLVEKNCEGNFITINGS